MNPEQGDWSWVYWLLPLGMLLRVIAFRRWVARDHRLTKNYYWSAFAFHIALIVLMLMMLVLYYVYHDQPGVLPAGHMQLTIALAASWLINLWWLRQLLPPKNDE